MIDRSQAIKTFSFLFEFFDEDGNIFEYHEVDATHVDEATALKMAEEHIEACGLCPAKGEQKVQKVAEVVHLTRVTS